MIAGACVLNNILDRSIDREMQRTKRRALVTGSISVPSALLFALVLIAGGSISLLLHTTTTALAAALFGVVAYVILYGIAKRSSTYGTLVGSISGAVPPVVGYTAVTGSLDAVTIGLFLILVAWQMPHFYAIAIFRKSEYTAARVPVLSVIRGNQVTATHMQAYMLIFTTAAAWLSVSGNTGATYLAFMILLSGWWLRQGWQWSNTVDEVAWAKSIFKSSLVILLVWSILIAADVALP